MLVSEIIKKLKLKRFIAEQGRATVADSETTLVQVSYSRKIFSRHNLLNLDIVGSNIGESLFLS